MIRFLSPAGGEVMNGLTMCLCLSVSVLWLYQGSSLLGSACHTYFSAVLMRAFPMRMHR